MTTPGLVVLSERLQVGCFLRLFSQISYSSLSSFCSETAVALIQKSFTLIDTFLCFLHQAMSLGPLFWRDLFPNNITIYKARKKLLVANQKWINSYVRAKLQDNRTSFWELLGRWTTPGFCDTSGCNVGHVHNRVVRLSVLVTVSISSSSTQYCSYRNVSFCLFPPGSYIHVASAINKTNLLSIQII